MFVFARAFRRLRVGVITAAVGAVVALVLSGGAAAAPSQDACDTRVNNTYKKVLECIRVGEVREHQAAFQAIADANGGIRAAGTSGYTESVDYVVETLTAAGWNVELDEFPFTFFPPATLRQLTPVAATYETGVFTGSGTGSVTGPVIPVDLNLAPPRDPVTSGCEAADFAGLNFSGANDIALIQRGTCTFADKALNAQAAGAEAVVIFNQGNTPVREGLIIGTLAPSSAAIPVVGASFADGAALAQPGSTAHVNVDPPESRPQVNVIAELPGANDDNVVMAGAHLDSVLQGPGINDNGSGSAALLEVAQQLAKLKPQNTIRLAWWGAEEAGLIGSTQYVNGLSQAERDRIALYLNFDMVGSPNYIFMVYDGDESGFPAPVGIPIPPGSVQIEDLFESYYTWAGEPYDDAQFSGRSDYQAFILNDIPAGGLFTGAEVPKTAAQQAIWGGTVGAQYDPCYHLACDTFANNSMHALDVNSDSIAFAVLTYAYSTETVNGVPGKNVPGAFTIPAPAGPEGTVGSGGGAEHEHSEGS
jgi:Zn-dependent M28 family amino/carboxypeptidase